ncbi:MAG: chemotaxis protein CheA [Planctomycetia bacterium]|nr:chemotaxis protein CheA [Planctomycetia bacterium]
MNENEEFVREFLVESAENLDQLDQDLVALEENPRDPKRLASIFRTVHTIKGTSGFFGFAKLGAITHSGEHLLGQLRDGTIELSDRVTGALLTLVDAVRSILETIEKTGNEGDADFRDLSQTLARVAEEAVAQRQDPIRGDIVVTRLNALSVTQPTVPQAVQPQATIPLPAAALTPLPTAQSAPADSLAVEPEPTQPVVATAIAQPKASAPAVVEASIRVDVGLLGSLVDLVGELVLARNQLQSTVNSDRPDMLKRPDLLKVVQRIHAVTGGLQSAVMKTRMQPIDQVLSKFPRIVRDLAVTCGKEVQLLIDGADTELDRSLIETIRDPLTHLVRNAVDHGIEPAAVRTSKGKPPAGRLSLRAFHESGRVTIEIKDDGGGIPVEAVRAKAIARGLIGAEEAGSLSDEQVLQFIFEPGFSTAAAVTDVSGRGVGMDVVKTNIEAIGGTVDISSQRDVGTTVRVRVPLTLAIIPALIVTCAGQRFAIPQAYVRELIALRAGSSVAVEGLAGAPVMRVRGRLTPLVFLDSLLDLSVQSSGQSRSSGTVVIVRVDDYEFGLVVEGIASSGDIVVKPIAGLIVSLGFYAGATVMGDGAVVLILDPRGIAQKEMIPARPDHEHASDASTPTPDQYPKYLLCETVLGRQIALPLEDISRLEIFSPAQCEQAVGRMVVHRDGRLTALADIDNMLEGVSEKRSGPRFEASAASSLTAVIVAESLGDVGLRVKRIVEVIQSQSPINSAFCAAGVLGTIAIGGRATEVIDVRSLMPEKPNVPGAPSLSKVSA